MSIGLSLPGVTVFRSRQAVVFAVFAFAIAAMSIACGSSAAGEPDQPAAEAGDSVPAGAEADNGIPAGIDKAGIAATIAAFQVQSVAEMDDSGSPVDPPRPMPAFTLTDHESQAFDSKQLDGKHVLVSFAYTHCPDVCPALFGHFIQVQRELEPRIGDDLELVIISVDPERDTPEWLNQRTTEMGGRWHFLTGTQAELESVWADFGVRVEKQGEFVGHTGVTYLVNLAGELSVRYPAYATFEHFIRGIESETASG